ncbi:nuclear transport factor 2 family protein [Chryseobacterium hagamense]|uniref:SnoaL-like domain-containing protein n=1 Tax=Chryseobacterium hagamense TaxID=395935 RepID=A0A511YJE9_9FLAO|nr:nuclear transport factor 2 family protein [Chryseobacterium hagamense]GEN75332.1 hypothetical protein CHA01nite_10720 [Chryseobacterium hagamense]
MEINAHYLAAIENYIGAYNRFDVSGMCRQLSDGIIFENISGGNVEMNITGIENFKKQAEAAVAYFSERHQKIEKMSCHGNTVTAEIDYTGKLAADFPNGMKKGEMLKLRGVSEFTFEKGEIISIRDIS